MTNCERSVRTINWEIPDRILTYDFIDNRELLERFGGKGDLIVRNARTYADMTDYRSNSTASGCVLSKDRLGGLQHRYDRAA